MNPHQTGGTRPFGALRYCARLGFAAFELLQPDLARAVSPMLDALILPRAKAAPSPRAGHRPVAADAMLIA